jgi:flagellar hook-basal body complex protein FliE
MPTPTLPASWTPAVSAKVPKRAGRRSERVLKDAIGSVLEAGKKSDAQTVAMASGKANVMDVVTAVAETDELLVSTVRTGPQMI